VTEAEDHFLAIRLTLTGACPVHGALTHDLAATRKQIPAAVADVADPEHVWFEDVRVHTRPVLDVAALAHQAGVVGTLIQAISAAAPLDAQVQKIVAGFVERHGKALADDHPARTVAAGQLPDELVERARALVLASLRL
jgi:hypothetical protein